MQNITQNLQTLGKAFLAAQCQRCYYYPGMKGDVLATTIDSQVKPSLNERNAFEFGYGACLAGARTAVILKTVGLATCLDSIQHAVIQGVNAGLVIVVLEDTVAASSPEVVDSRLLMDYASTLIIEPSTLQSAMTHIYNAFDLSETLDVPVVIRLTYDLLNTASAEPDVSFAPPAKIVGPSPAYRQKMLGAWVDRAKKYESKLDSIDDYIDSLYPVPATQPFDALYFGYHQDRTANALAVEHYPIARSLLRAYTKHPVAVHELGSNYVQQKLHSGVRLRVDNTRALASYATPFNDWESALQRIDKHAYRYVVGDEGRFTLDSTELVDVCLCMGSSIAIAAGMSEVTGDKNLAIIGDFSYLFNGYTSLLEAHARGVNLDVVILDDGCASSTGGQTSITPVDLQSVTAYAHTAELRYDDLPNALFTSNAGGITISHIRKRPNA